MNERFRRVERLRKTEEIRSVLRQRGMEGTWCILHTLPNRRPYSRLAVVVSRAVGNAVVRNQVKRRMREIFRRSKNQFQFSIDLVIRAKRTIREADYCEMANEILDLLSRKRVL